MLENWLMVFEYIITSIVIDCNYDDDDSDDDSSSNNNNSNILFYI